MHDPQSAFNEIYNIPRQEIRSFRILTPYSYQGNTLNSYILVVEVDIYMLIY